MDFELERFFDLGGLSKAFLRNVCRDPSKFVPISVEKNKKFQTVPSRGLLVDALGAQTPCTPIHTPENAEKALDATKPRPRHPNTVKQIYHQCFRSRRAQVPLGLQELQVKGALALQEFALSPR